MVTTRWPFGARVSRLALGTMTFAQEGWGCDPHTAGQILDVYLDAGGNLIDTADIYSGGASEQTLGGLIAERNTRIASCCHQVHLGRATG